MPKPPVIHPHTYRINSARAGAAALVADIAAHGWRSFCRSRPSQFAARRHRNVYQHLNNFERYAGDQHGAPDEENHISESFGVPARDRELRQPVCYLHVGTHKTGTTSIQRTLSANEMLLARIGFTVPRAGRSAASEGHHNVAWELAGDARFDARRGSLDDMLRETAAAGTSRAIVSSEDFEYLHARPDRLRHLADGFARIGFAVVPVVYLRPQAGYAESLYAELVKHGLAEPFPAFLDAVLATGEYRFGNWCFTFDYARLLEHLAAVFGAQRLIVRSYTGARDDVVDDFLRVVGAGALTTSPDCIRPPRLNAGSPFARVLRQLACNAAHGPALAAAAGQRAAPSVAGAFDPVHLHEAFRITARFNPGNRRVYGCYRVAVPCVSGADLCADFAAAAGIDAGGRVRKHIIAAHARDAALLCSRTVRTPRSTRAPGIPLARVWRRVHRSPLAAAARSESIAVAAALGGAAALVLGALTARTALTEFGLLSALVGAMAAARLVRCTLAAHGTLVDDRFFGEWALRLTMAGYGVVALFAAVNALLDLGVPRYTPDWISVSGAAAIALTVVALHVFVPSRSHAPDAVALRSALARPAGESALIVFGSIALGSEALHAVDPVWWLDTLVDVLAVAVAYVQYQTLWRRLDNRDASEYFSLAVTVVDAHA